MCASCKEKDEIIVALQHIVRELRHEVVNVRIEVAALKGDNPFGSSKAA